MSKPNASEGSINEDNNKPAPERQGSDAIKGKAADKQPSVQADIWTLEDVFPKLDELLDPSAHLSAADKDTLVVLDTKRNCISGVVGYCEWFDWSALFDREAPARLLRICRGFDTSLIQMACLATDGAAERIHSLRVIEIAPNHLSSSYSKAIWDDQSTPFGGLAVMARIVAVWDPGERWLVVNDRFYEIGVFAILDEDVHPFQASFFEQLDQQELLSSFSEILRIDRDAASKEVERWDHLSR